MMSLSQKIKKLGTDAAFDWYVLLASSAVAFVAVVVLNALLYANLVLRPIEGKAVGEGDAAIVDGSATKEVLGKVEARERASKSIPSAVLSDPRR